MATLAVAGTAAQAQGMDGLDTQAIAAAVKQVQDVQADLHYWVIERSDLIELTLSILFAREHICLIGKPGLGKTMLVNELASRITSKDEALRIFYLLITRFTTIDELLGPVKVSGLKNDEYGRNTKGRIADCDFAILDEIWNGSGAINTSMNTMMNERYIDNDGERYNIDLLTVFAASNRIPIEPELQAPWDRFLGRYIVKNLTYGGRALLLDRTYDTPNDHKTARIAFEDVKMLQDVVPQVKVPAGIRRLHNDLFKELNDKGIFPSDRRFKQCVKLMQAHALLNGRMAVRRVDFNILENALWEKGAADELKIIKDAITNKANNEYAINAMNLHKQAYSVYEGCMKVHEDSASGQTQKTQSQIEAVTKLRSIAVKIRDEFKKAQTANAETEQIVKVRDDLKEMFEKVQSLGSPEDILDLK